MSITLPSPATLRDAERDLVRRVRDGDTQIYRLLVERHQARIFRLVSRLLGPDHGDIDDVVQEVFVKAFFSLRKFREDAAFGTWITRIAINRARDELKKQSSRLALDQVLAEETVSKLRSSIQQSDSDDVPVPETDAVTTRLVAQAVGTLPHRLRIIITLKDMEGYSYQEVSEILKCSIGTVKSRHSRARERLREVLAPYLPELVRR